MPDGANKPIRLSAHARGYAERRGFSEPEVAAAIRESTWTAARHGRMETYRDFPFNAPWNGAFYEHKRVRPVFVDEPGEIVVVTVYTYFIQTGEAAAP